MKHVIGLDFGTLSGRALLVEAETGRELAAVSVPYRHGCMSDTLPGGKKLPPGFALQHPNDYLNVIKKAIPKVCHSAGVSPASVIGIGVDFTASTVLPADKNGTPLCLLPAFRHEPHAYVKLWKHLSAQAQAERIAALASTRGERFIRRYGGKVCAEWLFPKALEVLEEAPEVYAAADCFIEAGDWLVWRLTGNRVRNGCAAGFKAFYDVDEGYPSDAFCAALHPGFSGFVREKLGGEVRPAGTRAGGLTPEFAALTGLNAGTAVSVAVVDAHAGMLAAGMTDPGSLLMLLGTSACYLRLLENDMYAPGISGVVKNGLLPGLYVAEGAHAGVGDHFAWVADTCVPAHYRTAAKRQGLSIHTYLSQLAESQAVGQHGLTALEWFGGVRAPLFDAKLRGVIAGLSLNTKPEDVYRALIEATAFGTKKILEVFWSADKTRPRLLAAGGVAQKNPLLMQVYADVLNSPIELLDSADASALGAAVMGATAAGSAAGGYDGLKVAAKSMCCGRTTRFTPRPEQAAQYEGEYERYCRLFALFAHKPL